MGEVVYYDEWKITKEMPSIFGVVDKYCCSRFRDTGKDCLTFVPPTLVWAIDHGEFKAPKGVVEMSPVLRRRLISMALIMLGADFDSKHNRKAGILSLRDFEKNRGKARRYIQEVRQRYNARAARKSSKQVVPGMVSTGATACC